MGRKNFRLIAILLSLIAALSAAALSACGAGDETSWKISSGGGEIKAYFSDNGSYGYILNVEGEGALPDYGSANAAPWYYRSGRITEIKISDGITALGANAFTDIKAERVILPESVTELGAKCFNERTRIYAYGAVTAEDGAEIYVYSETKPEAEGNFWHYSGEFATVWENGTKKILFIGNSFTYYNDMPSIFGEIVTAEGVSVEVGSITQGSQTLTNWVNTENEKGRELDALLNSANDYDIAVIQEQSTRPLNHYDEFLSAARTLAAKIRSTQTDCKIYLYSTWGYASQAEAKHLTIPEMEAQLRSAYVRVAEDIGARVSYAGKAFTYAYENYTDINLYNAQDNMHPSYEGSYLAACVHAGTIFGLDPRALTFNGELSQDTAAKLKETAYRAVAG